MRVYIVQNSTFDVVPQVLLTSIFYKHSSTLQAFSVGSENRTQALLTPRQALGASTTELLHQRHLFLKKKKSALRILTIWKIKSKANRNKRPQRKWTQLKNQKDFRRKPLHSILRVNKLREYHTYQTRIECPEKKWKKEIWNLKLYFWILAIK